ncbi:MAG TPA: hypothetical protein VLA43_05190 [Longimicrobiales bacterium]|nr:hypothetical protein [Longimicrobiales bacterium]
MFSIRSIRVLGVALLATAAAGCSTSTDPDLKPTRADITISGSTTVPLRLIVSTDFYETINQLTGERGQVFNSADTLTVETLPYVSSVQLSDLGSVVVDLSNPSDTEATVRLQVAMDSGQSPYDQTAIMSQGGALRFVFSYYSPTF